jgi:hypothetical protein
MTSVLHVETKAALRDLQANLPRGAVDPALLATPLARIGDALRLGLKVPAPVMQWALGLKLGDLAGALGAVRGEVRTWSLPEPGAVVEDDPTLAFAVRRRDEAESVQIGVLRLCLPKGIVPGALEGFAALRAALADFDARLHVVVSRSRVEELLGARAALLGARSWTAGLREEPAEAAAGEGRLEWNEAMLSAPPSDEVVTRYVSDGALARYVEGFAAKSRAFAEELAAVIDGLLEQRESVGLAARRWRKHAAGFPVVSDPASLPVRPALRLAAATEPVSAEQHEERLGQLVPLDAEGRIVCTARTATLWVYPGQMPLSRVEFGGVVAEAPEAGGDWRVEVPVRDEPMALRVVAGSGEAFEIELRLAAAERDKD